MVDDVALFLDGKQDKLVKQLRAEMDAAAEDLQFEKAARLRDQIQAVETLIERQKVVSTNAADQDVVALVNEDGTSAVQMFFIRNGKLIGQEHFLLEGTEGDDSARGGDGGVRQAVLSGSQLRPQEIILPAHVEETVIIEQWLQAEEGHQSHADRPRARRKEAPAGDGRDQRQARPGADAGQRRHRARPHSGRADGTAGRAGPGRRRRSASRRSTSPPSRAATRSAAWSSSRTASPPSPSTAASRSSSPTNTGEPNDFAMMREVLTRRLTDAKEGDPKFSTLPDLMLIDGGKGQLGVAVSVAAGTGHRTEHDRPGQAVRAGLTVPDQSDPLVLPRNSAGPAPAAARPRRSPPLLRHLPPHPARQERDHVRAGHHPRHRPDPPPRTAQVLRQRGQARSTPASSRSPHAPAMNKKVAASVHKLLHGEAA